MEFRSVWHRQVPPWIPTWRGYGTWAVAAGVARDHHDAHTKITAGSVNHGLGVGPVAGPRRATRPVRRRCLP